MFNTILAESGEIKKNKVIFEETWVSSDKISKDPIRASKREWQLIRVLLRGEPVHWSDGFVIFDVWRKGTQKGEYKGLFGRVTSNVKNTFSEELKVKNVVMTHPRGKPEWWKLTDWHTRIAVAAAASGEKAEAMRIWLVAANANPARPVRLRQLANHGLKDDIKAFYHDLAKKLPQSNAPEKALKILQEDN